MAPTTGKKRETSDGEEEDAPATRKRVKWVPTEDDSYDESKEEQAGNTDADSVETVEATDEDRIKQLVMADVESDPALAASTFEALALLCYQYRRGEEKAKKLIFRFGGHTVILKAMEKHADSVQVQKFGCLALGAVSCNKKPGADDVVALGGIDVALRAMKRFHDSEPVQCTGLYLLGRLCFSQETASRVTKHTDGISSIIAAMNAFPQKNGVQLRGCTALATITSHVSKELNQLIIKSGGGTALAKAQENHFDDESVRGYADCAMKHLQDALRV